MDTLTKITSIRHQLAYIDSQVNYSSNKSIELEQRREKLQQEYYSLYKLRSIEIKPYGTDLVVYFKKQGISMYYKDNGNDELEIYSSSTGSWIGTGWTKSDLINSTVSINIPRELIWENLK